MAVDMVRPVVGMLGRVAATAEWADSNFGHCNMHSKLVAAVPHSFGADRGQRVGTVVLVD